MSIIKQNFTSNILIKKCKYEMFETFYLPNLIFNTVYENITHPLGSEK